MIKKSNLNNNNLVNSQLELLKINNELKNINNKDKELFLKEYQEVLDAIKPISKYVDKIKNITIPISIEKNSLFKTTDEVNKLINEDDFNRYEFKYKKLQKNIPLLKLKSINFKPKIVDIFDKKQYKIQDFNNLNAYLDSIPDIKIKDTNLEKQLQEKIIKIEKIKNLIKLLIIPLDIKKINNAVQLIKIINKDTKNKIILSKKTLDITKINKTIQLIKLKTNKFDEDNKKEIEEINLFSKKNLDSNLDSKLNSKLNSKLEPFNLEGGDISTYLNNISKKNLIINNLQKLKNLNKIFIKTINEFKVYYIQYKYYQLFLIQKLNITNIENQITVSLSLDQIFYFYKLFNEKYKIIINPKEEIFNKTLDIETKKKRKKMFLQYYFQIYIIYHFLKFLMIKIINDLNITSITSIDNINIDDYEQQFTNSKFIYFLYDNDDDENKIELQKLLILLNILWKK
jgi:hypothetical protein